MNEVTDYKLKCLACGAVYDDSPNSFLLACSREHEPSLLRTVYAKSKLEIRPEFSGVFKFSDWLPVRSVIGDVPLPAVFHSKGLGKVLGLDRLYVVFNGYWPEKGAFMETCTFKELETPGVCARMDGDSETRLVVASAGNTARAFLKVCSENRIAALVVVPERGIQNLWTTEETDPCVQVVSVNGRADYLDAIDVGAAISGLKGYCPEGGAKNVGRRDGLGIALLTAVSCLGEIPQHYFQAVGSGTGGIAAWEAVERLAGSGFGSVPMQLHLAQNHPFTIMVDAWAKGKRSVPVLDAQDARERFEAVYAHVLSNRKPPYSVVGGVYDALRVSGGNMYSVANKEAQEAGFLFQEQEGCDLDPAAQVALAALRQACQMKSIGKKDLVLLNITGGGFQRLTEEKKIVFRRPDQVTEKADFRPEALAEALAGQAAVLA